MRKLIKIGFIIKMHWLGEHTKNLQEVVSKSTFSTHQRQEQDYNFEKKIPFCWFCINKVFLFYKLLIVLKNVLLIFIHHQNLLKKFRKMKFNKLSF